MTEQILDSPGELPQRFALPGYETLGADLAALQGRVLSPSINDTLVRQVRYHDADLVIRTPGSPTFFDETNLNPTAELKRRAHALYVGRGLDGFEQLVAHDVQARTPFVATEFEPAPHAAALSIGTLAVLDEGYWEDLASKVEAGFARNLIPDMGAENTLFGEDGAVLIDYALLVPQEDYYSNAGEVFAAHVVSLIDEIVEGLPKDDATLVAWHGVFFRATNVLQRRYPDVLDVVNPSGLARVLYERIENIETKLNPPD